MYSHDKTKGGSELGMENATLDVQGNIYQHPCKTVMDERHHDPSTNENPPFPGTSPPRGRLQQQQRYRWRHRHVGGCSSTGGGGAQLN